MKIDPLDLVKSQCMDGMKWAESFCEMYPDGPDSSVMVGWFANAIMTTYDSLHHSKIRPLETKAKQLLSLSREMADALEKVQAIAEMTMPDGSVAPTPLYNDVTPALKNWDEFLKELAKLKALAWKPSQK